MYQQIALLPLLTSCIIHISGHKNKKITENCDEISRVDCYRALWPRRRTKCHLESTSRVIFHQTTNQMGHVADISET
jgi:hypothetical protein